MRTTRTAARAVALAVAVPFVVGLVDLASAGAAPSGRVELTFTDPAIVESSGLVARDGLVVTVNDSGDTGRVFAVDRRTGDTVGVTTWSDDPEDVEALAPAGAGHVWVADIGDNAEARDSVSVTRVPVGRGDHDVRGDVTTYELVYPGGARDAETLLVDPDGRLVVVTKGVFGAEVLRAPARLDPGRPNRMRAVGTARAIATDGAFWPDGRHLVVRGYSSASVYAWPSLGLVARFDLPDQPQGEGITVDEDGVVLISTEGVRTDVLRVRLPRRAAAAVAPVAPVAPPPSVTASPSTDSGVAARPVDGVDAPDVVGGRSGRSYVIGAGFALVMLVLLVRSLRPRG
ncbi:hypothetical protein [Nocardioides rubriscoriae]|uniref:hypothetical protein n=1 Tax=Nocardioides rubriscoriae TaxID=642762 RepID=UPI0011DFAE1F|nr:hypothetical protein [Nocardioides rubriscoriae]